jgi:hypothetical protein
MIKHIGGPMTIITENAILAVCEQNCKTLKAMCMNPPKSTDYSRLF